MNNNSGSVVKKVVWITILLAIILLVFFLVRWAMNRNLQTSSGSHSPYILELTSPVYSVSGKIEKISGKTVSITVDRTIGTASIPSMPGTESEKPKAINFEVVVEDGTQISQPIDSIAALPTADANSQNTPQMTINDLKVGQVINVMSKTDLRLGGTKFNAQSITLAPKMRSTYGQISAISGNTVTVKSFSAAGEQSYILTITNKTTISSQQLNPEPLKAPKVEELEVSDLKVGMSVNVTAESELMAGTAVNATKIDVSITPSVPESPSASGSAMIPTPPPTTSQATSSATRN